MPHAPRSSGRVRSRLRPHRTDDAGEMLVLMAGLTLMLLGVGAFLLHELGRPLAASPAAAGRQAALAGAAVLRQQALSDGLSAADLRAGSPRVDVTAACDAATAAASGAGAQVVTCALTSGGLTVVTARTTDRSREAGQSFDSAVVALVDTASGCLAMRTSWGPTLPATCSTDSSSTR